MSGAALLARDRAALEIIRSDPRADPLLMLSFVIWPPEGLEQAVRPERGPVTWEECEHMFEAAKGLTHREIGKRVGRPRTTVSQTLRLDPADLLARYGKGFQGAAVAVGLRTVARCRA